MPQSKIANAREPKYWAFISYSHRDKKWGDWLHQSLETYRVPKHLVGRETRLGPVPKKPFPIFRDREELPGSAELGANLEQALRQSRYIVVICSPMSAASHWVNEEIRKFKAMGGEDRVLCLVVGGEPNASDRPLSGELECFPEAVRYRVDSEGHLSNERVEPIAADARPQGDGKLNAKLKILAGILGVNYDDLKQREKKRRLWQRVQWSVVAVSLLVVIFSVWVDGQQRAAEQERVRNRQLSALMLQQAGDALQARQQPVATLYAANAIRYALLAGDEPSSIDLLSSLSPPALLNHTIANAGFSGGLVMDTNGKRVIWGTEDGRIQTADAQSGTDQTGAKLHDAPVHALAISADGRWLASGDATGRVLLRDSVTGRVLADDVLHAKTVSSLAFQNESGLLASASFDRRIAISDIDGRGRVQWLEGHAGEVNAVDFVSSKLLVSGSKDNTLRLWDLESGQGKILADYGQPVMDVTVSDNGRWLAAAVRDGSAKLWSIADMRQVAALGDSKLAVYGVGFSPDGNILAVAHRDRSVRLWEVNTHEPVAALTGHTDEVWSVVFHPDSHRLVSAALDGELRYWQLAPRQYVAVLTGHDGPVRAIDYSGDGRFMATGGDDRQVIIWDTAKQQPLHQLSGHKDSVRALSFSPDGRWLASTGRDGQLFLWEVASGRVHQRVQAHDDYVVGLSFNSTGEQLALASWDHTASLWSVPDLKLMGVLSGHTAEVSDVGFSPDGARVATVGYDATVRIWDSSTRSAVQILEGHNRHVRALAWHPKNDRLVSGGWDRQLRIWDVADWVQLDQLEAHHSFEVWDFEFSPDGKLLASATPSQDARTLRLFDFESRKVIVRLAGHDQYALTVAFNPTGSQLASGGTDGVIRLWHIADFWPDKKASDWVDPGSLLRDYLDNSPYQLDAIERLISEISALTGYELVGTVAMPAGRNIETREWTP